MPTHTLLLTAAAGALLLGAPSPKTAPAQAPPGMVKIDGGRVKIGSTQKDIEALIRANESWATPLIAETPQHTVQVDDFYLMVSEVTNEQFAVFVTATGSRPPYTWGSAAVAQGLAAFHEEQQRKRMEAQERGARPTAGGGKFDPERWWKDNWQDHEWHVPEELADHPVTYVAYEDALGYALWAGLRLMTEPEFQCAGRGTGDHDYPWGKDWDPKKAAGLDAGRDKTWPIASFPDGARNGVYDLIGNVWEWTSSPYTEYPGYKPIQYEIKRGKEKETLTTYGLFDANQRILVGGSVNMDALALRITVRRGADRSETTNAAGFRCAASIKPGRDLAEYLVTQAIPGTARPADVDYELESPTLMQRWTYEVPGAAEQGMALPEQEGVAASKRAAARPPGYAVITGYDAMLFVPVKELAGTRRADLEDLSLQAPVHIGLFYLTKPLVEPALAPGAYMVAYRGAGALPELAETAEVPAWRTTPHLDPLVANYVFYDTDGLPLTAWPAAPINYESLSSAGSVKVEPFVPPKKVDEDAEPPVPIDTLRFYVGVQSRQRGRGYKFDLPFKIEPGTVDGSWHSN